MSVVRRAVTSVALLHETRQKPICQIREIATSGNACRSLVEESLYRLQESGALTIVGEELHVTTEQRLRIAELAVADGADPERVARQLRWQEFEAFANEVLDREGFATAGRFVFKSSGRRFEIDIVGAKEPLLLCIDCKHWHHGWAPSKLVSAAKNQFLRAMFLSVTFAICERRFPSIATWRSARLLPVVLTLADVSSKLIDGVPIVSVLRFRDFLSAVNPWVEQLRFVEVRKRGMMPPLIREGGTTSWPLTLP